MSKRASLIGWLLMILSAVALMGSDSDCQVEMDDGEIQIDTDHEDPFWEDWFEDKRVVSDATGMLQPIPLSAVTA